MIRRDAANIVRTRLRQTQGLSATITRAGVTVSATVALGSARNETAAASDFQIERDRHDVFVSKAAYGPDPEVGDTIVVTMLNESTLTLGVYVPEKSNRCFQDSEHGTELRVFCQKKG